MYSTNGFSSKQKKIACSTLLLGVGLVYIVKRWIDSRSQKPSGNWKEVGVVSELKIYPIKSCKGIGLEECNVTSIGLQENSTPGRLALGDRRLVVYREPAMEMVSARTYFQMLQVEVNAISENCIALKYHGEEIIVELPEKVPDRKIRLWTEHVPLVDCGDEVSNWLERVVYGGKKGYRLGYYPNPAVRRDIPHLCKKYQEFYPFMRNEFTGAFSDLSPFLLLNESSIADLNSRIKERAKSVEGSGPENPTTVSCSNFRGNIIVNGPQAYEEDEWKWVKIGNELVFRNFKPCTRCSLTTVNPNTSVKDKHLEPITTLKTYRLLDDQRRKLDPSPAMGIYLGLWAPNSGKIKVGDIVYVCD